MTYFICISLGLYTMNNILSKKAKIWCQRLNQLMKDHGYTQETFLKEYKSKYGGGTQANVSRWLRVGSTIQSDERKTIGFPSYENMVNIADFFGVTIGYLTGETNFKTFDMEKSCSILGITEETGDAIKAVASGKSIEPFGKYHAKEYSAVLQCILTADSFPVLVKEIQEYVQNLYNKKHPVDHVALAAKHISPEILDLAFQCLDYQVLHDDDIGDVNDFKENHIEPTDELLIAISALRNAIDRNYCDELGNEQNVKLSEYELQKIYFSMIKELVEGTHLAEMAVPRYHVESPI